MKFLVLFIDMLRPDLLHTWNQHADWTSIDKWMQKMGGTAYLRAYTPGPDTPRSQAAAWSSRYPKINGCDTRIKYPMYYLHHPKENFLRVFKDAGYQLNFYISKSAELLGELPENFKDSNACCYSNGRLLKDFLTDLDICSDSLTYIFFDDFHYAVDDYFAREHAVTFGIRQIMHCLDTINHTIGFDTFDYMLLYSDHGYKKADEIMDSAFLQLGDRRSRIFLYSRDRNDCQMRIDKKIRSVMDLGPALCEKAKIKIPYETDGISLFSVYGHNNMIVNDHKTFDVSLNQTIEYWGIHTKEGFAAVDCHLNWEADFPLTEEKKAHYRRLLEEKGDFFKENTLAAKIRCYYDMYLKSSTIYFDGKKRKKHYTEREKLLMVFRTFFKPLVLILKNNHGMARLSKITKWRKR